MTKNDIAINWLMRFAGRKNRDGFAPPISKKKKFTNSCSLKSTFGESQFIIRKVYFASHI